MKYIKRHAEKILRDLTSAFPVTAVLGARQAGKTTLVQHVLGDKYKTITFDPVIDVEGARADPELFLQNNPPPIFLDEIQYAPELTGSIKRMVDKNRAPGRYVISGSHQFGVIKNLADSLAGRVAFLDLYPLTWAEITGRYKRGFIENWVMNPGCLPEEIAFPDHTWHQAVWHGGYPGLMHLTDAMVPHFFTGYERTYIERDVRVVNRFADLQTFTRFFRLLAGISSSEIVDVKLGRDIGIDRRTAVSWRGILEQSFQWQEFPPFTRNATKRISGRHKGFLTDTGLLCHQLFIPSVQALASHPQLGSIMETWVVMEIFKRLQILPVKPGFFHYRAAGGAEMDLVVEFNGRLYPMEVKHSSNPGLRDIKGFASIRECCASENFAPGLLICAVEKPRWMNKSVLAVPWWML